MSTKTVDTTDLQFDPTSMNTFTGLQGGIGSNLQDFMRNPLQSSFFNTQLQMNNAQNRYAFGGANRNIFSNLVAGGNVGNAGAFTQDQLRANNMALSGANANSFNNLLLGANQLRFGATQGAMGYRPLQTGQTRTKTQSGLGTWLPQLISAGIGAAGMAFGMPPGVSAFGAGPGGSMMAKAFSGAPMSVDQSMMPSDNTLIGPNT
jgi:hypothetical protein